MTQFQRARTQSHDPDPVETAEWLEALEALTAESGTQRAQFVLAQVQDEARRLGVSTAGLPYSAYRNTIPLAQQPAYPGDLEIEERIISIIRWNALAMVVRANQAYGELGGHIASYASAAEIFELGFNHFFRARSHDFAGDLVYFQPHSAPGVYARAFWKVASVKPTSATIDRKCQTVACAPIRIHG